MGKLRSLFTWFRDVHAPTRAARAVRDVTARAIKVDDSMRAPHWYVFFYRSGEVPRSGVETRPKESFGPYATRAEAVTVRDRELAEFRQPRRQYKLRFLTEDRADALWNLER